MKYQMKFHKDSLRAHRDCWIPQIKAVMRLMTVGAAVISGKKRFTK